MEILERDSRDHAKTFTVLLEKIATLESAEKARQINEARMEERALARGQQLADIKADVAAIKAAGGKLLWIVVTSVVGAVLLFIYRGGLSP